MARIPKRVALFKRVLSKKSREAFLYTSCDTLKYRGFSSRHELNLIILGKTANYMLRIPNNQEPSSKLAVYLYEITNENLEPALEAISDELEKVKWELANNHLETTKKYPWDKDFFGKMPLIVRRSLIGHILTVSHLKKYLENGTMPWPEEASVAVGLPPAKEINALTDSSNSKDVFEYLS